MADKSNSSLVPTSTERSVTSSNNPTSDESITKKEQNAISNPNRYNILDRELEPCSMSPLTGYMRTGKCETNEWDYGTHLLCAKVTKEFLEYTKSKGNDLSTPSSWFPGLKPGDNWCLCVGRWAEAYKDGKAPPPVLSATNKHALKYLKKYNLDLDDLKKIKA